eukprot:NODE_3942_length_508_cov_105.466231_g3361_i0.p3 GENE.NODE_3942_length_508_cov_105.466231_g3361_i0~~NODE_3942_length_508_cov_105.466231_g3361_i0.p3  ORF type:complete len:81 (-),score=22.26 NODE_3942_length_508_cov_105.466231_g3361_i0:24-266(-)
MSYLCCVVQARCACGVRVFCVCGACVCVCCVCGARVCMLWVCVFWGHCVVSVCVACVQCVRMCHSKGSKQLLSHYQISEC